MFYKLNININYLINKYFKLKLNFKQKNIIISMKKTIYIKNINFKFIYYKFYLIEF